MKQLGDGIYVLIPILLPRMSSTAPLELLRFNSVEIGGTVKGVESDWTGPKCY